MSDNDAIETIEHESGIVAKIYPNFDPMSPADWDNLTTFSFQSSVDFNPGNAENLLSSPRFGSETNEIRLSQRALSLLENTVSIPIRFDDYGSSGARIYETDAENANGLTIAKPETVAKLGIPNDKNEIARQLRGEIEQWNQYLQGDVYGYVVETESGDHLDSCWGFYGREYAREEAQSALTFAAESELRDRHTAAQMNIPTVS